MNIKIQGGGGGTYANNGTCGGVVSYLQHEDAQRIEQGQEVEQFFTNNRQKVNAKKVRESIDNNKKNLGKSDAKFYVITISPSKDELKAMGSTAKEQSEVLKQYVDNAVMKQYAESFNKGLTKDDLMYYAKIHHTRGEKGEGNMHVHIIVSRKDINNNIKLSPKTNHRGTTKGAVKGGFDRTNFYNRSEKRFDIGLDYKRDFKQSFEYQNTMKNGTVKEIQALPQREVEYNKEMNLLRAEHREKRQEQQQEKKQEQHRNRNTGRGM